MQCKQQLAYKTRSVLGTVVDFVKVMTRNVEHYGGELEWTGTGILCHWWVDEWCNIFKIRIFNVQCKLTRWTPHYLTPRQWIHRTRQTLHCVRFVYQAKPPLPQSALIALIPSCSLWCRRCSLAVALSSHSRCNLSLTLSRFISVELHGEESCIAH